MWWCQGSRVELETEKRFLSSRKVLEQDVEHELNSTLLSLTHFLIISGQDINILSHCLLISKAEILASWQKMESRKTWTDCQC